MALAFTKMHGLGNDFMVINAINQPLALNPADIQIMADRHRGIGFDQCLVIEASDDPEIDFNYRIFNADGNEVGQCGNGARCLARYVFEYGLTDKKIIKVATATTRMILNILPDDQVRIDMGTVKLNPKDIPLLMTQQADFYTVELQTRQSIQFNALSVYERGCGETEACGSGAVAAAALAHLYHGLSQNIKVSLPGGDLFIDWPDQQGPIYLTGPAAFIYDGIWSKRA